MHVVYPRYFERVHFCPACKSFIWERLSEINRTVIFSIPGWDRSVGVGVGDGSRWGGMYLNPGLETTASSTGCIVGCSVSQFPDKAGRWYKERAR